MYVYVCMYMCVCIYIHIYIYIYISLFYYIGQFAAASARGPRWTPYYGDLTITSPTIISDKTLMYKQYISCQRGELQSLFHV